MISKIYNFVYGISLVAASVYAFIYLYQSGMLNNSDLGILSICWIVGSGVTYGFYNIAYPFITTRIQREINETRELVESFKKEMR